jgi:hypothetical protein
MDAREAMLLPTYWIMRTAEGWYPIQPSSKCKPEDHGALNPHVVRIEDMEGNVLWDRSCLQ